MVFQGQKFIRYILETNREFSFSVSVCLPIFSMTAHLIEYKLAESISEDPWKSHVIYEVIWMSNLLFVIKS